VKRTRACGGFSASSASSAVRPRSVLWPYLGNLRNLWTTLPVSAVAFLLRHLRMARGAHAKAPSRKEEADCLGAGLQGVLPQSSESSPRAPGPACPPPAGWESCGRVILRLPSRRCETSGRGRSCPRRAALRAPAAPHLRGGRYASLSHALRSILALSASYEGAPQRRRRRLRLRCAAAQPDTSGREPSPRQGLGLLAHVLVGVGRQDEELGNERVPVFLCSSSVLSVVNLLFPHGLPTGAAEHGPGS